MSKPLSTPQPLIQREAARRKREQWRREGIEDDYTDETLFKKTALWLASRGRVDPETAVTLDWPEFPDLSTLPLLGDTVLDYAAQKLVADYMNMGTAELENVSQEHLGRFTFMAAVEIEADLLADKYPEFMCSSADRRAFIAQSSRKEMFGY